MSVELRKYFERQLQENLKKNFNHIDVKILKGEIIVGREDGADGRIGFRFLKNANGYILSASADSPELQNFYKQVNPPYKPNVPTGLVLAMNTSMETVKSFSPNVGGTIDLPRNEGERQQACQWICEKVQGIYLPRVVNAIDARSGLVADVLSNPDYYSYPFLTALFSMKKNGVGVGEVDLDQLLGKRVSKNKSFDGEFIEKYLSS